LARKKSDFTNVRYVAYHIVYEVMYKDGFSNLLLQKSLNDLSDQDKGLCTNIVYGTIQNYDLLRYQLSQVKYDKLSNKQEVILLISLYQKHFLDKIPDYAIVNEAEKVTVLAIDFNAKKFVVSLLRQLLDLPSIYSKSNDSDKDLSINYSHPLWFIKMIKKQYGEDVLEKILQSNNRQAKIHVRYNVLSQQLDRLESNPLFEKSNVVDNGYFYLGNGINKLDLYEEGIISVQDFSSQLVALTAKPKANMKVLDMCAAPGTKTMHLAELMNNEGLIKAYDIYDHKIDLINNNAKRLGIDIVQATCCDATQLDNKEEVESFDLILCDAVCTGLGVIKRKPEIKYQDIASSMDEIIAIQKNLLKQAYRLLKKGGILVYSTCTINKKENEFVVKDFINMYPDMVLESQKQILGIEQEGDGFYIARLIKK